MRTKVQKDEVHCDRCDVLMREVSDERDKAASLYDEVRNVLRGVPDGSDLCASCSKRVLVLAEQILKPRKRAAK
jgi:ribosomal protein L34E